MTVNPRHLVAMGYDEVADTYLDRFGVCAVRRKWLDRLKEILPDRGGKVLDLGCGAGIPVARDLAALGHAVVGVDGSAQQICRARHNVPTATFIKVDMCEAEFEAAAFDAIGAFYSIIHVPVAEQRRLIRNMAQWLKSGGTLIASFGTGEAGEWTGEWLGTAMFFGHGGKDATLGWLRSAGLTVRQVQIERQENEDAAFLWVEAVKAESAEFCLQP